jgi:hypothetical protein
MVISFGFRPLELCEELAVSALQEAGWTPEVIGTQRQLRGTTVPYAGIKLGVFRTY